MIFEKIKIGSAITLIMLLISAELFTQESNDIKFKFTQTDSSYKFYGSFKIKAHPKCLLEISFNYTHIRELALDAKKVQLISQGNNWNQISYIYRKFIFFKNTTVWHRTLNEENQRVNFALMSSKNNQKIMPRMLSSSGYYQITQEGEYSTMEYFQQCQLSEESITNLYIKRVKKNAMKFMHKFSEYANSFCNASTNQSTLKIVQL